MGIAESLLAFGGAALSFGLMIAAIYEAYALYTGRTPPITTIVRENIAMHTHRSVWIAAAAGLLVGWLIGHLGR